MRWKKVPLPPNASTSKREKAAALQPPCQHFLVERVDTGGSHVFSSSSSFPFLSFSFSSLPSSLEPRPRGALVVSEVCARAVGSSLSLSFCLSVQPTYSLSTFLSWFVSTVADTFLKSTNPTRRSLNQGPVSDSFVSAVLFFFFFFWRGVWCDYDSPHLQVTSTPDMELKHIVSWEDEEQVPNYEELFRSFSIANNRHG